MKIDKLNRWRWILLVFASLSAVIADVHETFSDTYVLSTVLGIGSFASAVALGVLLLIRRSTITSKFRILLMMLFGAGILIWFLHYLPFPDTRFFRKLEMVFWNAGLIFSLGPPVLLLFCYIDRTSYFIPMLIPVIIIGLILNRLGVESEAEYFIFFGYFLISACLLIEAIYSMIQFRKRLLLKRLFFFMNLLLCICTSVLFVQYASYEAKTMGIYDLIQIIFFLLAALFLFIVLPFSNYMEWAGKLKRHFTRIILLPAVFLFVLLSMRFVLPPETYQKIFFKEHSGSVTHFHMEDYKIKKGE